MCVCICDSNSDNSSSLLKRKIEDAYTFYDGDDVAAEVIMFDSLVVVYKFVNDVHFYATGLADENELIIHSVLQALTESISILLR